VNVAQRVKEIRQGFQPPFWVANGTELFERLAYYGAQAVLAIYLHEHLRFSEEQTGLLQGVYGFVVWILPIFGGALADLLGFRRILSLAYLVLSLGYFLIGSITAGWLAPVRAAIPLYWVVFAILMVPALGPGLVKPVVAGTTARGSSEAMRSLGYSIY
jgi:POT family proton-dependent oligopeptide transporter